MKTINWNDEKNAELQLNRGITFEEIVFYIREKKIVEIIEHPNKSKYANQKIFVISINEYIYLVPFIENDQEIFLKTIIPSRKANKKYKQGGQQ